MSPGTKLMHWTVVSVDGRRATCQCQCLAIRMLAIDSGEWC
jgi:hypothetical protein